MSTNIKRTPCNRKTALPHRRAFLRVSGTLLSASLLLVGALGCADPDAAPALRPVAVRATPVRQAELATSVSYVGTIHSAREVLVTARVQGTLAQFPRVEGETVEPGEILALLSAPQLDAAVERLQADDLYWTKHLAEDLRLAASGAIPQEQVAGSTRAAAMARAALAEAEDRRSWTVERSPFRGRILEWRSEPGQHVMPGQALLLIGDEAREIRVPVLEEDLRRGIAPGTRALVESPGRDPLQAVVAEVGAITLNRSRAFTVKLPLPATADDNLRHGASAPLRFILKNTGDTAVVPTRAIAGGAEDPHVYLVEGDKVWRWQVRRGLEEKGWTAIEPPPPAQAWVATTNLDQLSDGAAVFSVADEGEQP